MSTRQTGVNTARARARDLGLCPGILPTGIHNSITDVEGVLVGHFTMIEGDRVRTGATAIRPHPGNLFCSRVPAGIAVANGFGKLMGSTQVAELGELETPVVLTNTLCVSRGAEAILDWVLAQPGVEGIRSINPVVGETNDGRLNDIRARVLTPAHILQAIESAHSGAVQEGAVGAGTGTVAFGWKGGIGTSSRVLPASLGGYVVGALVQSNFGGVLQLGGVRLGELLKQHYLLNEIDRGDADGSIMIVLATDAPLSDRNLKRLAERSMAGLARTGSSFSNGSGDYAIAFSTAPLVRRIYGSGHRAERSESLTNEAVSPLFHAAIEATEEAIYNSLLMAGDMHGYDSTTNKLTFVPALPLAPVVEALERLPTGIP